MWRAGIFGGRIDCWNKDPGFPLAMGDPHPDALLIEGQLEALADTLKLDAVGSARCPLDLSPYPIQVELRGEANLDVLISNALNDTASWLVTCAIHGTRPDVGDGAACEPVRGANGKITLWRTIKTPCGTGPDGKPWFMEHDEVATSKGDSRDAWLFCKLAWTRTSLEVLEEQLRYAMWHAALVYLVPNLQFLASIEVLPPRATAVPWLECAEEPRIALPDARPVRHIPLEERRPAGRRTVRRTASPVRHIDPSTWKAPSERSA